MTRRPAARIATLIAALLAATAGGAATAAIDLRQIGLSQAQVDALNAQLTAPRVAPGIAFGSPVGFGAGWGDVFFSVGGQTLPEGASENVDGSATLGFGLLDPHRWVGLEVTATSISIRDDTAEDGTIDAKLHRVLPGRAGVAIGVDSAEAWGAAEGTDPSTYVAFTKVFDLNPASPKSPWSLAVNLGAGNERYAEPDEDVGVFGSLALLPHRQVSIIADWSGRDANAAISMVPHRGWPVVLTLGAINLTERYGRETEFAGSLGLLFQFH